MASQGKRKNHEVSRCLLLNWLDDTVEPAGINYFDLKNYVQKFEVGKRANFAITEYLYTPKVSAAQRQADIEDWFSVDETALGMLARAAHNGAPNEFPDDARFVRRAIRGCISLGCRSAYSFYLIALLPGLPDMLGVDSSHKALVANCWNQIANRFSAFLGWDFSIVYDLPGGLLINEQPFRDWTLRPDAPPFITMPLSPTALLMGRPPQEKRYPQMQLSWIPSPTRTAFVQQHNNFVVETARQWVAGPNRRIISEVAPRLTEELVRQRQATDRHVLLS